MTNRISSLISFSATGKSLWRSVTNSSASQSGDLLLCDTTDASFTVTLPATPAIGSNVTFKDPSNSWGTNPLSIDPGNELLFGTAGVKTTGLFGLTLIYLGGPIGWVSFDAVSQFGATVSVIDNAPDLRAILGLSTMAQQGANAVAITGGAIDGTMIGGTTPATGNFTTLTANTPAVTDISTNVATTAYAKSLVRGNWRTLTSTTALANGDYPSYFFADTSAGAFTLTLPASPVLGATIMIVDAQNTWQTHNLTINPNGGKIAGSTANLVGNVNGYVLTLIYNASYGWKVMGAASQ